MLLLNNHLTTLQFPCLPFPRQRITWPERPLLPMLSALFEGLQTCLQIW